MAISTTPASGELRLALDDILVGDNVRDLDEAHVDSLAQSIALRGLLVPLIVRPTDAGYELVAGFHRYHACRKLGLDDAPVVLRDTEGSSADAAAENVTRKQLTPLEEAKAVQAMLDEGYTLDGAAQALGWSRQLVTARAKILRLSEPGQALVGSAEIPVSAIDTLLAISDVSPGLAAVVVATIASGAVAGSQLVNNAGWAIGQALRNARNDTFAAYLNTINHRDLQALRLGKKTDALITDAEKLHKQIDQYAYGPPTFRFEATDIDQARAAGVLIELDGSAPIITDRALYRELAKQAVTHTVEQLRERAAAKASGKRTGAANRERTPRDELDAEHRAIVRELTRQAHATNLDLGSALLTELATVAPDDIHVARFFALGLLGPDSSSYLGTREHTALTVAANGLRLVLDEHRETTTPTLKSGKTGKTRVAYADVDDAVKWLWRFVDGAKTAGEIYGRVLVVFAAQHYATQLVLPASKRRPSALPASRKDAARKAFERIVKTVLPASHKQLQRALAAEARSYDEKVTALAMRQTATAAQPDAAPADDDPHVDDHEIEVDID
jgi:ParB/RepB/Spo0J family partition protein